MSILQQLVQKIPAIDKDVLVHHADSVAYLSIGLGLVYIAYRYQARKGRLPLPPCPPKQGLLGHVAIFPKTFEYFTYEKWAKELDSDIIHLQLGLMVLVVLHSWEAVSAVLEKQATIYSDRYQDTMLNDVVGWDWLLSNLPYGDRWRKGRALFQKHLHPSNVKLFEPRQLAFVRGQLLPQLLEGPGDIIAVVKHFTAGLSISMAYGIEIQPKNDPYVKLAADAVASLVEIAQPGKWMVSLIPPLKYVPSWFPGAGWKRQALVWRKLQEDTRNRAFDVSMQATANGTVKPSFVAECVRAMGDDTPTADHLENIKDVAAIIFGAGADTTAGSINNLIVAMLCHPEIQDKAREELDRVLGPNRLPTFEDKDRLPYITAIVKEALRWQCPNPIAVPHMSSAEGEYNGYRIPKGALVIGNIWALVHNEVDYPEPMKFKPERFLNPDGSLSTDVRDPTSTVFGFGRRLCPGRHIALSALWLSLASILAAFKIEKGLDEDGNEIEPEPIYMTGFARVPAPFKATFKLRSEELGHIIRNAEVPRL